MSKIIVFVDKETAVRDPLITREDIGEGREFLSKLIEVTRSLHDLNDFINKKYRDKD